MQHITKSLNNILPNSTKLINWQWLGVHQHRVVGWLLDTDRVIILPFSQNHTCKCPCLWLVHDDLKCENNVHKLPSLFLAHDLHLKPCILSPKNRKNKPILLFFFKKFSLQGSITLIVMHLRPHILSPKNTKNKPMILLKKGFFPCKFQVH